MAKYSDKAEIMAIGDSMYQGVRSLSITADKALNSPPALVAKALRKPMSLPLMQRPILYDLEVILRHGGVLHLIETVRNVALQNVDAWLKDPVWSPDEAFDNLSFGGAAIDDLAGNEAARFNVYWPQFQPLQAKLAAGSSSVAELAGTIGKLWYALNTCFVLNPSRQSPTDQSKASPLEQVAARRPDLLLVNIGSNEGLFRAGFTGHYDDEAKRSIAAIPTKMETLARYMRDLLPTSTNVVVNSILKPRFIPNLMPRRDPDYYPGAKYFLEYIARLGDGTKTLTADDLAQFDKQVAEVNADTKGRMEAILGERLAFVDLYSSCDQHDGKHFADRYVLVPEKGYMFRNIPLEVLFGHFQRGGITGLDNMHPTVVGNAVLAQTILQAMQSSATVSINEAYEADTLLTDLVGNFPLFQIEMALLGSFGLFSNSAL